MITPPPLKKGDTIGIIAPARSISQSDMVPFLTWAKEKGYQVELSKNIYGNHFQYSGTDTLRLEDLEKMVRDDHIKAIIAARGGYGSGRLLEDFNIRLIREHPKWLVGFSDITALLSAVNRIAGVEALHSWMPGSLDSNSDYDVQSLNSLQQGLSGQPLKYQIKANPLNFSGVVKGQLTGGNLSVLNSLAGSPYEPIYKRKILFLEDVDEYLYHIDRMVLNLELRGIFNNIAGLIVGSFHKMNDNEVPFGKQAYEIIAERVEKYNIPALFGFPAGHNNQNYTLIFGRDVTLTINEEKALLEFSG